MPSGNRHQSRIVSNDGASSLCNYQYGSRYEPASAAAAVSSLSLFVFVLHIYQRFKRRCISVAYFCLIISVGHNKMNKQICFVLICLFVEVLDCPNIDSFHFWDKFKELWSVCLLIWEQYHCITFWLAAKVVTVAGVCRRALLAASLSLKRKTI